MRLRWEVWVVGSLLALPTWSYAATCTTQAELSPQDRDSLSTTGARFSQAVLQQDLSFLQGQLLPAEASEWQGIRDAVEQAAPVVKGGQIQIRDVYLLDASSLPSPADTQFFCSNSTGSLTVTISMRQLPPGRYAVVLADAVGAPLAGQLALVLASEGNGSAAAWKLAGLSIRQGTFAGHDGVWYWSHARELAKDQPWSAWFCYQAARYLLIPVDFISSPNLEKLSQEQAQIKGSPQDIFPYTLQDGPRTWKIDSIHLDPGLHEPDLAVTYESAGVTDPAAARTEAVAVLSALLKTQPGLKENFHGMWAYAMKDGKRTTAIEFPMAQIP